MGRRKIDIKIHRLISLCLKSNERAFFIVSGKTSRDQIVLLHHVYLGVRDQAKLPSPSILWCYKKDNGFNFICQKMQQFLKKKYSRNYAFCEDDVFAHFLASNTIQFCHYNDTASVLGQTFSVLIIQDFEATTPNILARIIECIEGGGIIIMILPSVQALQDIASMKMDAHSKYVTSAYPSLDPLFNFRFVLSLADCNNCMILDDSLKILYCCTDLDSVDTSKAWVRQKLGSVVQINSSQDLDRITSLCCTTDQNNALQTFISVLKEKTAKSFISLTSARGRGKSATLGLAISCALFLKYSRIFVTSPHVENLQTLFKFIINGIKAFEYREGMDYSIIYRTYENQRLISGLNIFHDQRQIIKYLLPTEFSQVGSSDIVVIDEAAAIPLPVVKKWLKSDLLFMASTVNGYEGTGRSLSLKLMSQLREESQQCLLSNNSSNSPEKSFTLHEITLNEAIRYADGDSIEAWLNKLFCLDTEITYLSGNAPDPKHCQLQHICTLKDSSFAVQEQKCELGSNVLSRYLYEEPRYYVNKKVLFSYQKVAENFLQKLTALFVSSHYKNSPNDLLMLADAPSHHLFCLLPPINKNLQCLPDILCVIQIALEGNIPKNEVIQEFFYGKRASGDLVPWIISQQFQDNNFPSLSGARIVRIATHPNVQRMGYGQCALHLLFSYYGRNTEMCSSNSNIRNKETTLLLSLDELEQNKLHYIGVSYGLTLELLKFWKKLDFVPLYLRQTASETTGENSCVMIRCLEEQKPSWLSEYLYDFLQRFLNLLSSAFKKLPAQLALEILHNRKSLHSEMKDCFINIDMQSLVSSCSRKRIEAYCNHLVDYHLIMDLMPVLARCYFFGYFQDYFLSSIQECVFLSMCLQNKSVEKVAEEISMETTQVMGIFMKISKKILHHLENLDKQFKPNQNLQDPGVKSCQYNQNIYNSSNCKNFNFKRKDENPSHKKDKKHKHKLSS